MTWVDYAVFGVILVSIGWGLWRGLVREVMSLVGWVIAFLAANLFAAPLSALVPASVSRPELRVLIAFVVIFFVTLALGMVASLLLSKVVKAAGLGSIDRALGALFGLLRALLIVLVAVIATGFTSLPASAAWKNSLSGDKLGAVANGLKDWLPPALAERMKYN
jgi:membrane protein required for colicin V production